MSQALDEIKIGGLGASRKRVEDNRFIRGKGNYTDDITLPGMLHMEILRSPLAHARIKSIDASKAWDIPGVRLVLTGEMMATRNLAWMPTLSYDTQAVLATDKVRFQGQEVACVIADDPYIAKDACEVIDVEYEPLPAIVNPIAGRRPRARRSSGTTRRARTATSSTTGKSATPRAPSARSPQADLVSRLQLHYPRSHPSPIECCGSVADFDRATSKLTVYMTTQAPHIIRAAVAMVAELPEHMIRIISPDIGGGFGNKVPVYPGYVCSILASILLERPVKWIEDKSGNLISTHFARDIYLDGEMALRQDGKILAVRMRTQADHGAFFSDAQPSKFKIGLMHSAFAAYDIPVAHMTTRGTYTNKAPGGVAYRCSFRVTEAMFFQERMMQAAAQDLGMDQAAFRRMNFVRDDDFPHRTPFGFLTDSGQYGKCLDVGLRAIGYEDFRQKQEEAAGPGPAARPRHLHHDRAARRGQQPRIRHPRHQDVRLRRAQGAHDRQGHRPHRGPGPGPGPRDDLGPDRQPRARHPGGGHRRRGGRHRHRAVRDGHLRLPQHAGGRGRGLHGVPQDPGQGAQAGRPPARGVRGGHRVGARPVLRAQRAGPRGDHPGMRDGRVQQHARRHGARPGEHRLLRPAQPDLAVRGLHRHRRGRPGDRGLGRAEHGGGGRLRGPDQPDDRRGPDHGRPDRGLRHGQHAVHHVRRRRATASARTTWTTCCRRAWETPGFELHSEVVTPCPHHPIGAKGIGECAAVGGPAAFVNAVLDALSETGVRNIDMPLLPGPGLGGDHPAPRRLRRAPGPD